MSSFAFVNYMFICSCKPPFHRYPGPIPIPRLLCLLFPQPRMPSHEYPSGSPLHLRKVFAPLSSSQLSLLPSLTTLFNTAHPLLPGIGIPIAVIFSNITYHLLIYKIIHLFMLCIVCLPLLEYKEPWGQRLLFDLFTDEFPSLRAVPVTQWAITRHLQIWGINPLACLVRMTVIILILKLRNSRSDFYAQSQ